MLSIANNYSKNILRKKRMQPNVIKNILLNSKQLNTYNLKIMAH